MTAVLWLLLVQGLMGAFDTLYYHEWRARLPAGGTQTRDELRLHAVRDFVYALIFASLPWIQWRGALAVLLAVLVALEIVITLVDFAIEDRVRIPLGGVFKGERATHTLMAIVYGAMLGRFVPELLAWSALETSLTWAPVAAPPALRWLLTLFGLGVLASGLRDLGAVVLGPRLAWPWARQESPWR